MRVNNYNGFILESLVFDLLLESKLSYMKDFSNILQDISTDSNKNFGVTKIAKFLEFILNKDLDISQNFIDIEDGDKVSFVQDNRVKRDPEFVSLIIDKYDRVENVVGNHRIIDMLKIPREGLIFPNRSNQIPELNKWKIIGTYNGGDAEDTFKEYTLFHLQNVGDPSVYIIVCDRVMSTITTRGYETYYELPSTRGSIKIGRLVNRLIDIYFKDNDEFNGYKRSDFTASDIEQFVNYYTAKVLFKSTVKDRFEVVSGEDIRYWYLEDRYSKDSGQLGSSCMRYKRCQEYLDIYVENPEVCSLLILKEGDGILGRALLWTDINDKKWIDRIYTYKDSYYNLLENWAKDNGYDDAYNCNSEIKIKLGDKKSYDYYPYMDTFRFFKIDDEDDEDVYLTNEPPSRPYYILQETNGSFSTRG